ncbi:MAG: transglycosylase SLT domain-containing protein [Deltaproteobacteria bacterium]|jgi:hypothetical protein|nr:transglycosylase SLT domain-containing protein [Deltaproteobacteria bacterium]
MRSAKTAGLVIGLIIGLIVGFSAHPTALKAASQFQVQGELSFSGEKVELDRPEVFESLDQELLLLSEAKSRVWLTLRRSERYLPIIEAALRDKKIPQDFKFVPLAVTNLAPDYRSGQRRGLWRFTESEALALGLTINKQVDERLDPTASSAAAAARLSSLKKTYGAWTMALAAFINESDVIEAQRIGESTDYYSLYFSETVEKAVSLVLAGKILYSNPEDFGYNRSKGWPILAFSRKKLDADQSMTSLAKEYSLDIKTFKDMNLHILGDTAPSGSTINTP